MVMTEGRQVCHVAHQALLLLATQPIIRAWKIIDRHQMGHASGRQSRDV